MSQMPKTVVIPAGSNSGTSCINSLLLHHHPPPLRACVRSPSKPYAFPTSATEFMTDIDASSPESLSKAFKGCKNALIVTPHDHSRGFKDDAQLTLNMINAAVDAGVEFIVLVGSWTVNQPVECEGIACRFIKPESRLKELEIEKGLKWCVLRGGYFTLNLEGMFKEKIKRNETIYAPDFIMPPVDTRDIGKCAAVVLQQGPSKHHGKHYEMSGPQLLTMSQIKQEIERAIGKEIDLQIVPADSIPFPPAIKGTFMYMVANGAKALPFTKDVSDLIGQDQCTSVHQYFSERKSEYQ